MNEANYIIRRVREEIEFAQECLNKCDNTEHPYARKCGVYMALVGLITNIIDSADERIQKESDATDSIESR